ncbi:MAG: ROK family protein [Thermoplasmata archaeon]|nr:ROK family protein [Thermoplasmata archaeon]
MAHDRALRVRRPGAPDLSSADTPAQWVGVDLGGTKVATGLVDPRGTLTGEARRLVHAAKGPPTVLRHVVAAARESVRSARSPPMGVGVGVAGQVHRATGTVMYAPNLKWKDFPLGAKLSEALGLPVAVSNDVVAVAWGEWLHGAGVGSNDIVCVFVGTGIGGGVVSGGRMLEGASSAAGEVGHTALVAGGRRCHCPNSGCLEAYAGGWAISERAREAALDDPRRGAPLVRAAGSVSAISPATVIALHRNGDPMATTIYRDTARYLSDGMVGIVNAFNPDRLILGGGVLDGWPELLPEVRRAVRSRCQPPAARAVHVLPAALGKEAGVVGSAAMARATLSTLGGRR